MGQIPEFPHYLKKGNDQEVTIVSKVKVFRGPDKEGLYTVFYLVIVSTSVVSNDQEATQSLVNHYRSCMRAAVLFKVPEDASIAELTDPNGMYHLDLLGVFNKERFLMIF